MRIVLLAITTLLIASSCANKPKDRKILSISLEKHKIANSSIRAIEVINDSAIVYAGSNGDVAVFSGKRIIPIATKIKTDTITPHFRALSFTKNEVYALSVGNPALLYQFKNRKAELVYKEENEKVFYDSMKFFDDLNGIAIGDPTENCLSILITRDGGNSWGKIDCSFLPEIFEGEAAFAASNTNISIVEESAWVVTGGKKARVFYTPDMGLTWEVFETPIVQGKETTGIYSVDFYNQDIGIICGGDYLNKQGELNNIAITNDGGKTWELVNDANRPKYVSCVQYVPNSKGKDLFAVSTNGIYFSNNYGENWKQLSKEGFYSIRIANRNTAYLSGNEIVARMKIN